jgi:hypothetical protein
MSPDLHAYEHTQVLYFRCVYVCNMVDNVNVKIYASKSRHSINLPSEFVRDSAFPFKVNEPLVARIDKQRVIIEKQ